MCPKVGREASLRRFRIRSNMGVGLAQDRSGRRSGIKRIFAGPEDIRDIPSPTERFRGPSVQFTPGSANPGPAQRSRPDRNIDSSPGSE
jgi:hypothetical protein